MRVRRDGIQNARSSLDEGAVFRPCIDPRAGIGRSSDLFSLNADLARVQRPNGP